MKRLLNTKMLLLAIVFLAFVVRFYRLGSFPAINADEAALGYNAHSLIKTGLDEHGNSWPIHFQSFNDFKPGLYVYLILPFVKVMGLTAWAIRIPGALLGVGTVVAIYFLAQKLFDEKTALVTSLFLAISPWHIHFSRGGWEVNGATFLITLGTLFFVKKKYLVSVISFVLSLYTYHAARLIVPLLGLGLLVSYWKEMKDSFKQVVVAGLIGIVLLFPLTRDLTTGAVASRAAGVGIFADPGPFNRVNEQRGEHADLGSFTARLLHNKPINYTLAFVQNWAEHFWGEFLFLSGDEIQRNKVPEMGEMYFADALFVLVGLFVLLKKNNKATKLVLWWLIIAPTAAALTFQSPHALRAHNMVIPLVIIAAVGFVEIVRHLPKVGVGALALVIVWQLVRYEHLYWVHMAKEYPFSSQYGVEELVDYIKEEGDKYSEIIITDRYDQPYILTLFYLTYPPQDFQGHHALTGRDQYGFSTVREFDKFKFHSIKYDEERPASPNALIIGTDKEIPDHANVVKNIYGQNGYLYFQVVAN